LDNQRSQAGRCIPALRCDWATPLYDPFQRWLFRERRFKRQLIEQADIQSGQASCWLCIVQCHSSNRFRTHPSIEWCRAWCFTT
jgi:hypothetical protein